MISPPGLKLLEMLVNEHRRDRGGRSALVPCVHEELEGDADLLAAGARRCGGALFYLDDDTGWEHPPGPVNRDRWAVLEGLVGSAPPDVLPCGLTVKATADGVIVALADTSLTPEPSLTLILRAAEVIASSAYDQLDLVIMAVSVAPIDADRRQLLWRMLTIDPADLSLASPTTIVPILGTRLDPQLDYRLTPEIRYVVRWDRVIHRSVEANRLNIATIANCGDQPVVLFLGAGASASAGIRLGNAYRDLALEAFVGRHDESQGAGEAFFDYLHDRQHFLPGDTESRTSFAAGLTLERVLRETFLELGFRSRTESPVIQELMDDCAEALGFVRLGRAAIRDLVKRLHGRLVLVTVNFDELIETDIGVPANVLYTPEQFESGLDSLRAYLAGDGAQPVPVLKIHGSISDPKSLIATIDSTSAGLHDHVRNALNLIIDSARKPLRWVWVGCSMRDRDVNAWLGGLTADALDEWWVDPLPGQPLDEFYAAHRAHRWERTGQDLQGRLVIDSADGFLHALADAVACAPPPRASRR
ncbi:SIR2 family protein [Cellulosimicrobium funkei]|uniref:SIR2 family protein n=1 Tax=Cellulosimicrobium funkei TaxID=264251 RepID=UPI00203A6787|nr:SIR2 family protein [Cellulosimicrobium funkei]MCM3535028.1 SIR2 family protein [Cellulosimicrobium funkei]